MKDNKGFSLIELIVLMGILAIVIGAGGIGMYGSIQRSKAKNQASDFNSKISELYSASMSKAEDYRLVATLDGDSVKYSFQRNSGSGWTAYNSASSKKDEQKKQEESKQEKNSLPELRQKERTVIINSIDGKTANATLEHEGETYPVSIQGITKQQQKKLKIGKEVKVRILDNTKKYTATLVL